jgi:hypothetical protein
LIAAIPPGVRSLLRAVRMSLRSDISGWYASFSVCDLALIRANACSTSARRWTLRVLISSLLIFACSASLR